MFHGRAADPLLGRRGLFAFATVAGGGAVVRPYLAGLVCLEAPRAERDIYLRRGPATGRLFGAQLGSAFIQSFVRVREQTYSNLIGLHVNPGSLLTDQRLEQYTNAVAGRSVGAPEAAARATALLARAVQNQAYVLAYIDAFMVLGLAVIGALLLMLLLRDPPAHLAQNAARR
jgi:hypothetical protein